jgi:ribosome biogenesis GTPase A
LEVLDARDPLGYRTKQIEKMILESGSTKRIILVLNKIGTNYKVAKIKNYSFLFKNVKITCVSFLNVRSCSQRKYNAMAYISP